MVRKLLILGKKNLQFLQLVRMRKKRKRKLHLRFIYM
jgi:hypothetical protein